MTSRAIIFLMKKVNVSTSKIGRFAGKWVVINPIVDRVTAVGETLNDISKLVTHLANDKNIKPVGQASYSFLVPRKDEGPYIL